MSLVKLLPAWLHAVADYAVGILLIVVALAGRRLGRRAATGVVVGAVVLLVSACSPATRSASQGAAVHGALGRRLPRRRAADRRAVRAELRRRRDGLAAFYVVMGVAVLAVSLITNYQYSPKREHDGLGAARPVTA